MRALSRYPEPTQAVILAAGKGARLGALTSFKPKCLLPVGSETILERQLRLLADLGIKTAGVVAGARISVQKVRQTGTQVIRVDQLVKLVDRAA